MFGKNTSLPPIETAVGSPRVSKFSLVSFAISLAIIGASLAGYVWNEQRAIARHQSFMEKVGKYIQIDPAAYDLVYEGKPVYFIATVGPGEELTDSELGFSAGKVGALSREVSMFQWVETEVKEPQTGEVTYEYTKGMSEKYFNSAKFAVLDAEYRNPSPIIDDKFIETNSPVFGAFRVAPDTLRKIMAVVPIPAEIVSRFPAAWQPRLTVQPESLLIRPTGDAARQTMDLGDLLVSYKALAVGTRVLVGGIQQGTMINPVDYFEVTQAQTLDELMDNPARGFEQDIWVTRGGAALSAGVGFFLLFGTMRSVLGGGGVAVGAVLSLVLACAQVSKYYWASLLDAVHILNIASALSGGVLVASIIIFGLRTVRKRVAGRKAPIMPQMASAPPPPPPSFNLDIPPAASGPIVPPVDSGGSAPPPSNPV